MIDHLNKKSHQSYNSGRLSPLYFERSYDSKRYMRTDDIDVKSATTKPIIPVKHPEGFKDETSMIEYRQIPKQVKLLVQQGRLPFTRRYGREKYGDDKDYSGGSILYHINQTERDVDPDMRTRRFKAEVRRSEPGAYSTKSNSVRSMHEIDNINLINPKSINSTLAHVSQKQIIEEIIKPKISDGSTKVPNSRFADRSNRSIAGNNELLNNQLKSAHKGI